jgi:hypothetical protein
MAQDKFQKCPKCGRLNLGTWCACPDWNQTEEESK